MHVVADLFKFCLFYVCLFYVKRSLLLYKETEKEIVTNSIFELRISGSLRRIHTNSLPDKRGRNVVGI